MTTRVNIVHISDLHFHPDNSYDIEVVLRALRDDLAEVSTRFLAPTLLVITGDIAKTGGADQYYSILEMLVREIIEPFDLAENVLLVPGNHDLDRETIRADESFYRSLDEQASTPSGARSLFRDSTVCAKLARKFHHYSSFHGLFEAYPRVFESPFVDAVRLTKFGVNFILINTAALSTGGLFRNDSKRLLICDESFDRALQAVKAEGGPIIVVGHHPLSELSESCASDISLLLEQNHAIYLHGHMHRAKATASTTGTGGKIESQNSAIYIGDEYWNGYSIISLVPNVEHVAIHYRTYSQTQRKFNTGTDVIPSGSFYTSEAAKAFWQSHPSQVDQRSLGAWVSTEVKRCLETEFADALYGRPLCDVFVAPGLSKLADARRAEHAIQQKNVVSIHEVITDGNFLLCSAREFGKTTLLKHFALEISRTALANNFAKVPVLFNFTDMKVGRDGMLRSIRAALPGDLPDNIKLDTLLRCGQVAVLVDDVNPEDKARFLQLKQFMQSYPDCKYVICLDTSFQMIMVSFSPELPVKTKKIFIQPYTRNQLRRLVELWTGRNDEDAETILNRMMDHITQLNLPITAVTGSVLLTILGKDPNFAPINRTVVVRQFVEVLLGTHLPAEALRETFDSTNKNHFLAAMAKEMVVREQYSWPEEDLLSFAKNYIEVYGFPQNPRELVRTFIKSRVLMHREGGVCFRYRSFAEYFIAVQMKGDPEFASYILDETRFLSYQREIEYYTGIDRNDLATLNLIRSRLNTIAALLAADARRSDISVLESLTLFDGGAPGLVQAVNEMLGLHPPSDAQRDDILDTQMPRNLGEQQDIRRHIYKEEDAKLLSCLMLYCRVLRNTEMISADEKRSAVYQALLHWSEFCVYLYAISSLIAKARKLRINGVLYVVEFGQDLDEKDMLAQLHFAIPSSVSDSVLENLGTDKLAQILRSNLSPGSDEPLPISFFKYKLILDLKIDGFAKELLNFLPRLRKSHLLRHTLLGHLEYVYRTSSSSQRDALIPVVKELIGSLIPSSGSAAKMDVSRRLQKLEKERIVVDLHGETAS